MTLPPIEIRTASAEASRAVGAALSSVLRPGDMVLLVGELGAGKTTLVQGMAAGLGVAEPATSPTFVLVRPYRCATPGTAANPTALRTLLHADLYRLEHTGELADLALGEMVEEEAAAVVEWGDVAEPSLGRGALVVRMGGPETSGPHERRITVELPEGRDGDAEVLRTRVVALAGAGRTGG